MKYLKTFERRYENKYRLGDYLLVDPENDGNTKPCVVIEEHDRGLDAAKVQTIGGKTYWVWDDNEIIRRLNPNEIEKFEKDLELNSVVNKYNL